jgi:hypothetical protein
MKTKRNTTIATLIALTAVLFITTGWQVMADIEPAPVLVPGGLYIGVHDPPNVYAFNKTVIPTDALGNTITTIYRCDNAYPNLGDPNPPLSEADHMTDFVGNAVRTGPNTWEGTAISCGTKKVEGQANPEMVWIAVWTGTTTLSDGGNTDISEGMFALYMPEQDTDGDAFPDEGQEPVWCGFHTNVARRLPMLAPCVPTTPPEGQ